MLVLFFQIEIKQKVINAKNRLTNKTDYYKSSKTKGKTKCNQMDQIKENKFHLKQILNQCAMK